MVFHLETVCEIYSDPSFKLTLNGLLLLIVVKDSLSRQGQKHRSQNSEARMR